MNSYGSKALIFLIAVLMGLPVAGFSIPKFSEQDQVSAVRFVIHGGRRRDRRYHHYPYHYYYRWNYYRPRYYYEDPRDYYDYDQHYYLIASSMILSVQEVDGKTRVGMSNGMEFDIEGVNLPFEVEDYANVYRKRTRDEGTLYELLIDGYKYSGERRN